MTDERFEEIAGANYLAFFAASAVNELVEYVKELRKQLTRESFDSCPDCGASFKVVNNQVESASESSDGPDCGDVVNVE